MSFQWHFLVDLQQDSGIQIISKYIQAVDLIMAKILQSEKSEAEKWKARVT